MPHISLGEAAKAFKVSKATLSRALKSGALSYVERLESGAYKLEPSEVARFIETMAKPPQRSTLEPSTATPETEVLAVVNARLEAQVAGLNAMVEELRSSRDHWQDMAQTQTKLLEHASAAPQQRRGGLFGWIGGRKAANG